MTTKTTALTTATTMENTTMTTKTTAFTTATATEDITAATMTTAFQLQRQRTIKRWRQRQQR